MSPELVVNIIKGGIMDIFISWSGEASHIVAKGIKEWLPAVIQSTVPFISSENIAKGTRWFSEIGNQLGKCNFGIICLTPENYKEPWILFEAGAISKSVAESCVAPILIGMQISDLEGEGPLAQFNATLASKDDILKLVKSINDSVDTTIDRKLDTQTLEKIFERLWPDLEQTISESKAMIMKKPAKAAVKPKRQTEDLLEELIELSRSNSIVLNELPKIMNKYKQQSDSLDLTRYSLGAISQYNMDKLASDKLEKEITFIQSEINRLKGKKEALSKKGVRVVNPEKSDLMCELGMLSTTLVSKQCEQESIRMRLAEHEKAISNKPWSTIADWLK